MSWPVLKDATNDAFQAECAQAANKTSSLAGRITEYPGGGVPAFKLREATRLIDEARAWLEEQR